MHGVGAVAVVSEVGAVADTAAVAEVVNVPTRAVAGKGRHSGTVATQR